MTFDPLDVVIVPFPFTDRAGTKRRPALVISSAGWGAAHQHVICAMITSAPGSEWPSDVELGHWREAGLAVPCRVRFKVFTLDQSVIPGRIGSLSGPDIHAANAKIADLLANV